LSAVGHGHHGSTSRSAEAGWCENEDGTIDQRWSLCKGEKGPEGVIPSWFEPKLSFCSPRKLQNLLQWLMNCANRLYVKLTLLTLTWFAGFTRVSLFGKLLFCSLG